MKQDMRKPTTRSEVRRSMSDISKSQEEHLKRLVERYKGVNEDIRVHENYKNTLKTQILDLYELLEIEKVDGVRQVEKVNMKKVSIRQIKKILNLDTQEETLLDSVMVEIDIDKTIDNFVYILGMDSTMANKTGERLKELHETKYLDLEIGK